MINIWLKVIKIRPLQNIGHIKKYGAGKQQIIVNLVVYLPNEDKNLKTICRGKAKKLRTLSFKNYE